MIVHPINRALQAGVFLVIGFADIACAAEHEVNIADYKFSPAVVEIRAGDTVAWINREKRTSHSVAFDASGEESERFFPGEKWSRAFPQAGRYEYHCGPHPEMKGAVVVTE